MDAPRELAQLGQRTRQPLRQPVDQRRDLGLVGNPAVQQAQLERERNELLLGTVVQVALDPPARRVGRLHDPQSRDAQLLQPRAQVGLQALVVDRQRRCRRSRLHELAGGVQRGVVDDRGHGTPVAL